MLEINRKSAAARIAPIVRAALERLATSAPPEQAWGIASAVLDAMPKLQWFVGVCNDQQELRAQAELREQGYIVYLPKIYTRVQDGKKLQAHAGLRFTGYIFIAFDFSQDEHGPISNTRGMDGSGGSALILSGGKPQALPAGIVETLRAVEDADLARALARKKPIPRKDLTPGDLVMIAGDRNAPEFGRRGEYLGTDKGVARILEAWAIWHVPECDLRKIEQQEEKAA